jgi:hypothetical protein
MENSGVGDSARGEAGENPGVLTERAPAKTWRIGRNRPGRVERSNGKRTWGRVSAHDAISDNDLGADGQAERHFLDLRK